MYKRIKPFIAGAIGIAEAEAVTTSLIKMKLYWSTRFKP